MYAIVPNVGFFDSWGLTGTLATSAEIAQLSKRCHLVTLVFHGNHGEKCGRVGRMARFFIMVIQYDLIWFGGIWWGYVHWIYMIYGVFLGRWQKFPGVESDFLSWIDMDIPWCPSEFDEPTQRSSPQRNFGAMPLASTLKVAGCCCTLIHGPELWPFFKQILHPCSDWLVLMCCRLYWKVVVFREERLYIVCLTLLSFVDVKEGNEKRKRYVLRRSFPFGTVL